MKSTLLKQAKVVDPGGPHNNKVVDILVSKGRIEKIGSRIPAGKAMVVRSKNLHVSLGWFDTSVHLREPGHEFKETVQTGLDAAAAGGFTAICSLPSTSPFTDTNTAIEFLRGKAAGHRVSLHPMGAISKAGKGRQLAELYDMFKSGAIAFTDDGAMENSRLLLLALQYQSSFGGRIVVYPNDKDLSTGGQMHEGLQSVRCGMKGIPSIAEEIPLSRDLRIQRYGGGHLHIGAISTAGSVAMVREAKAAGANITCSVPAHNLFFTDGMLEGFDSRYKVMPPLRSETDREALIEGIKDGTIDGICSDHRPEDIEHKDLEFDQASFGANTIEHTFAAAHTALQKRVRIKRIVECFAHGPRRAFGLPVPKIEKGELADLTYFDPSLSYQADAKVSKGVHSLYQDVELTGKVLGICTSSP